MEYRGEDGKGFFIRPMALALIECRHLRSKNKFVGPIDSDGEVANDCDNFTGLVYSDTDPNLPGVAEL